MPPQATPQAVVIRDFPGLLTNADPNDLPAGAAREQVNCRSERPGELQVRRGYVVVRFEG
jgi:hypothetical protein